MSCSLGYVIKSGYYQSKILLHREPIQNILKDTSIPDKVKKKLQLIQEVKEFSVRTLGLKTTNNYSTYVALKEPYVSWLVRGAYPYKLEPYTWWFPIVGTVPYKGFFVKQDALSAQSRLKKKGYDTYVRGVTAYSTLGWFHDPILSSMMSYPDSDLVNLIIHESVHATLFIKSSVDFNEQLASFVAQIGTQKFYLAKEGEDSPTLKSMEAELADEKIFNQFISQQIKSLRSWYEQNFQGDLANILEPQENSLKAPTGSSADRSAQNLETTQNPEITQNSKQKKKNRLEEIKIEFQKNIQPKLRTNIYNYFEKIPLNNAILLSYQTYGEDLAAFEKVYQSLHKNLTQFLDLMKTLEPNKDPMKFIKDYPSSSFQ